VIANQAAGADRDAQPRSSLRDTPVGAVLFDYGLTLVQFQRPTAAIEEAQSAIARCIEAAGFDPPPLALLRSAVHDRVEAEVAAHEASGVDEEVDVAVLEREAFAGLGLELDDDLVEVCSRIAQQAWFGAVRLYPDAEGTLRALRGLGLRLGLCSNAAYRPTSMHEQLRQVGLDSLLDAAVFSSEVGWRKPSARLFTAALEAVGAGAEHTIFVGDRMREDILGARAMGMRTVLVDRATARTDGATSKSAADAVIRSLDELPRLLEGVTVVTIRGTKN
jgi:putative hydrolase of the HAD superfamily